MRGRLESGPRTLTLPGDPTTGYVILLIGEVSIFLVIILDLTLLKPQKLKPTIWVGPLISMYILGTTLFTMLLAFAAFSAAALVSYSALMITSLVGAIIGTEIGKGIPLSGRPDGSRWYLGGSLLVVILLLLLLPRAIEQAGLIVTTFYQSGTVVNTLAGSPIIGELDAITGALVFFGVFLSIGWRLQVRRKQALLTKDLGYPEMMPLDSQALWRAMAAMVGPGRAHVLDERIRRIPTLELIGGFLLIVALIVTATAAILNIQGSMVYTLVGLILSLVVVGLLLILVSLATEELPIETAKDFAIQQHPEYFTQNGQLSEQGLAFVQSMSY